MTSSPSSPVRNDETLDYPKSITFIAAKISADMLTIYPEEKAHMGRGQKF